MRTLVYMLLLAVGFIAGWVARGLCRTEGPSPVSDTVTVVDTIPYHFPVPRDSTVLRYETVMLQVADTSRATVTDTEQVADSVEVVLPITQKVYVDSLYRAYVSGYRASLDSIFITTSNTVVTKSIYHSTNKFTMFAGIGGTRIYGTFAPSIGIDAVFNGKYILGVNAGYYKGMTYGFKIGLKINGM